ncbi:MAG: hypothetical protein U5R31_11250 [Acidimicrobiia bacterium]|nr:hypothetical protein [Acidimicrobiia bacterium]
MRATGATTGCSPRRRTTSTAAPTGSRRLVDAAHGHGLAVLLDVVYNHLGPEGNVLHQYGPYFTDQYVTPWGPAVNFDGAGSDGVRRYLVENAVRWIRDFHLDGLRLDAVHAIGRSDGPSLRRSSIAAVGARRGVRPRTGRSPVIAECVGERPALVPTARAGRHGPRRAWNDDFHHALHARPSPASTTATTPTIGSLDDLGAAYDRWCRPRRPVLTVPRPPPRRRPFEGVPDERLVVVRPDPRPGRQPPRRRSPLDARGRARLRLAAAAVLLSPFTPLLFMGEEYGETAPFFYFVEPRRSRRWSRRYVRAGRAEFAAVHLGASPARPRRPDHLRALEARHRTTGPGLAPGARRPPPPPPRTPTGDAGAHRRRAPHPGRRRRRAPDPRRPPQPVVGGRAGPRDRPGAPRRRRDGRRPDRPPGHRMADRARHVTVPRGSRATGRRRRRRPGRAPGPLGGRPAHPLSELG